MALKLASAIRAARSEVIKSAIDAATTPGKVLLYTLPLPATTGAAITTQTLLATCVLSDPCGTVANGSLTLSAISDDLSADATGDIAFGRIVDGDGNFVADAIAGVNGSGEILQFLSLSVVQGGTVKLTSGVLNEGNA